MKHIYTAVSRHILLLLVLLTIGWQGAQAQVKIGVANETINQGAALEVESGPYPGNVLRGFLLPRVPLTNYATWGLAGTPTDGMVIFNTATTTGDYAVSQGIYCWYNFQWNRQSPNNDPTKAAVITSIDCQPGVAATGPYDIFLNLVTSYPVLNQAKQVLVVPGSAGIYQFTTNYANGYRFSASGTFTADQVGTPQAVNLRPDGFPQITGTDSFTVGEVFSINPYYYSTYCSFSVNATSSTDCSGPLAGTYKVNVPFDASNTKQITFVPPTAGDYTFRAEADAGGRYPNIVLTFTKSITFSAEQVGKPQPVTLVAVGTPGTAGTFNCILGINSSLGFEYPRVCSFSVTVAP